MTPPTTTLYRQVAAEGATYIGLLTVVLDSLAEDIRRAGLASAANDIQGRCSASNHAFLLLAHLESWAGELGEEPLKTSLAAFYAYVRSNLMTLQCQTGTEPFFDLAAHVAQLRATWQKKESELRLRRTLATTSEGTGEQNFDPAERPRTSWSA